MHPLILSLGFATAAQAAYVWPSKYDDIDDLLYLQSGYNRHGSLSDRMYSTRLHIVPSNLACRQLTTSRWQKS